MKHTLKINPTLIRLLVFVLVLPNATELQQYVLIDRSADASKRADQLVLL